MPSKKSCLVGFFLLCALPTGLFMAVLTPPGQVPDEAAHMARAAGLLRGEIIGSRKVENFSGSLEPTLLLGVKINFGYFAAALVRNTVKDGRAVVTAADVAATKAISWGDPHYFVSIPNTATYFPTFYLPGSTGLVIGRLSGATPSQCMLLARLAMLGAFLLLGALALLMAEYGEAVLLAVLLMPMSLFLAGSLNQDGPMVAAACFAAAALTRHPADFPRSRLLAILTLVVIVASKPPCLPLLGLLLLPLSPPDIRRRLWQAAAASLPVLAWVALISVLCFVPYSRTPYHPGPLWDGDRNVLLDLTNPAANLHVLLAKPLRMVSLFWQVLCDEGVQKIREAIGVLGLLNLQFNEWYYRLWGAAFVVALLGAWFQSGQSTEPRRRWEAAITMLYVLGVLAITWWAIAISFYLSWTEVGASSIRGIQGRYLLPLLPFLPLALPARRGRFTAPAMIAALPTLALAAFDFGFLPLKMVAFFYVY